MFQNLQTLDSNLHADLFFKGVEGYHFARKLKSAPLSYSEVVNASSSLPVVFSTGEHAMPIAVLSAVGNSSPFVDEDSGAWVGSYVPAHIRRYPFILGETDDATRYLIMIDRDASNFSQEPEEGSVPLFEEGQAPTGGIVERAKTFLLDFQRELEQSRSLFDPLIEHDVLVERQLTVTRNGQKQVVATGFRVVDMDRVLSLDDAVLVSWVRSGLMALIYAHLHSQGNIQALLRGMQQDAEAA